MARRTETQKRLKLHAVARLTPAHRLVDLIYLAHADGQRRVTIKQSTLTELSGYGRRHITDITRDLIFHGFLIHINIPGITPTYKIEDGHPRSHDVESPSTPISYTRDDVFLLQIHHAEVLGQEAPQVPAEGKLLARVLDALGRFGAEGCRGAHFGHREQCRSWEGGKRWATFSCCYPMKGQESLEVQWFQEQVQAGLPLLKRQERERKQEEEVPECRKATPEDLERGKEAVREIIQNLDQRKGSLGSGNPAGESSGAGAGELSPGDAQSATDGPVGLGVAVTAGLRSKTNEGREES